MMDRFNLMLSMLPYCSAFGILIAVLYGLVLYVIRCVKVQWAFHGFPEPKRERYWFFGHWNMVLVKEKLKQRLKTRVEWLEKFGKLYIQRFGPGSADVVVGHPHSIGAVSKECDTKPLGFGRSYRHALPWLGNGLILAQGKRWFQSRRLLTPSFHFEKLKLYANIYHECADVLIDNFDEFSDSGKSFDIAPFIRRCIVAIILQCAMSLKTECQTERYNLILDDTHKVEKRMTAVMTPEHGIKMYAQKRRY